MKEPYSYRFTDGPLTGLVQTLVTMQHRTEYSPASLHEDFLLTLASLAPERAREALASIDGYRLDPQSGSDPSPRLQSEKKVARVQRPNGPDDTASDLCAFFLALSDETRRSILRLLEAREQCVTEIRSHFELSQPTISRHLAVLKQARLVTRRRKGQHVFYGLSAGQLARSMSQFFGEFEQCRKKALLDPPPITR